MRVLADPAPTIVVGELADSSVNFFAQPWVNNADYVSVKFDITERVKLPLTTMALLSLPAGDTMPSAAA